MPYRPLDDLIRIKALTMRQVPRRAG